MIALKSTHPVIKNYYREIARLNATGHVHEGAVAPLFPDGALVDQQTKVLVYGLWEAKDLGDDLDREVAKKFKAGYPKENILFQTPNRLVIYRHGEVIFDSPIHDSADHLIRGLETMFLEFKSA